MFQSPEQREDSHLGRPAGECPAVLTLALSLAADSPKPDPMARARALLGALSEWPRRLQGVDWSAIDWTPDLAEAIGSRRWLRGLATMSALSVSALGFWSGMSPLEAAPALHGGQGVRDEYRSQMIMPLGLGGDSGRRMGASLAVRPASSAPERASIELTAVLAEGDSFGRMLQRAGVSAEDAAQASALVAGAVPLGQVQPGTRFDVVLGPRPAPGEPRRLQAVDFRARIDLSLAVNRTASGLALASRMVPVDATPLRIRGTVGPSLYRSARAAGAPVKAIQQYLQALDSHLNLEGDIHPGDSFDLVFAYKRAAGGEAQAGDLIYAGLDRGTAPVAELLRWGAEGQFFSADAITRPVTVETRVGGGSLMSPVNGRITSSYGMRFHPILGYARMHAGVDFGAAWGSPIRAAADGVVAFAGRHGGHGNYVRIEHGGGLGTGYGHMSSIAATPGERVRAGQVIGYVGSTGLSTGPHLHYEMYRSGHTVNPLGGGASYGYTTTTLVQRVDPAQQAAFKAKLAQLKRLRPGPPQDSLAMARPQHIALR